MKVSSHVLVRCLLLPLQAPFTRKLSARRLSATLSALWPLCFASLASLSVKQRDVRLQADRNWATVAVKKSQFEFEISPSAQSPFFCFVFFLVVTFTCVFHLRLCVCVLVSGRVFQSSEAGRVEWSERSSLGAAADAATPTDWRAARPLETPEQRESGWLKRHHKCMLCCCCTTPATNSQLALHPAHNQSTAWVSSHNWIGSDRMATRCVRMIVTHRCMLIPAYARLAPLCYVPVALSAQVRVWGAVWRSADVRASTRCAASVDQRTAASSPT